MTKKIRLMDETSEEISVDIETDKTASIGQDMVVKQLMKYLEAIDWKLWEMLKLMKAEQEEADEADSVDEDELPG
jgi:hypothetical protein